MLYSVAVTLRTSGKFLRLGVVSFPSAVVSNSVHDVSVLNALTSVRVRVSSWIAMARVGPGRVAHANSSGDRRDRVRVSYFSPLSPLPRPLNVIYGDTSGAGLCSEARTARKISLTFSGSISRRPLRASTPNEIRTEYLAVTVSLSRTQFFPIGLFATFHTWTIGKKKLI